MSRLTLIGRRVAGLLGTVLVVYTLAFVALVAGPVGVSSAKFGHVSPSAPLAVRYVDGLAWFLTIWDEPVTSTLLSSLSFTAVYLVPSMVAAVVVGTSIRTYTVGREDRRPDAVASGFTLIAVSVPAFLVALALRTRLLVPFFEFVDTFRIYDKSVGALAGRNLIAAVWPTASMALYLLAVQSRYAGDILREYAGEDFVKVVRAKGASNWRVGRHIFRTTAIPLAFLFATDMLGPLLVGVFAVEHIVGVPGIGDLLIGAVLGRDLAVIMALVVLIAFIGTLANLLQDVAYMVYDPRVEFEE